MINTAIIGNAEYSTGELIRLLLNHPDVQLQWIYSSDNAGHPVTDIHHGLIGETDLRFTSTVDYTDIDCIFCCTPHGTTRRFMAEHPVPEDTRIIDLSDDHRIEDGTHDFVYGLPELNRKRIVRGARHVANPGSFASAILPALLPLAKNLLINSTVHATAIIGSTDEIKPGPTANYSWRNDNVSIYKPFQHPHLTEIRRTLSQLQSSFNAPIEFIPMRGCFSRGILAALYLDCKISLEHLRELYEDYYSDHNFTFVTDKTPDLKDVVNTNKCILHLDRIGDRLLVTSVIDNLLKGASGTAVHNLNLLFGLHERVGLNLKPSAF